MNAAGLTFTLGGMNAVLGMPFFQNIVTNGSVSQGEFDGTRAQLAGVYNTLKNTPGDKIEAMVDKYNDDLTTHLEKFNAEWGSDLLAAFRDAQIFAGFISTVMAKSGLHE
jgi:hypothetical protein